MAIEMSIDLTDATFADIVGLVDAAHAAGVTRDTPVTMDGAALTLKVDPARSPEASTAASQSGDGAAGGSSRGAAGSGGDCTHRPLPQLGDAAIRSVVDILTGRQDPPRR